MKLSHIKHHFFNTSLKERIDWLWKENDLDQLKSECLTLYRLFLANKSDWLNHVEVISYLYYLCNLMVYYYQLDYVADEVQQFQNKLKELEGFIKDNFSEKEQSCIKLLSFQLKIDTSENPPAQVSIAKIRDYISLANAKRAQWGYSRGLAMQTINSLQNYDLNEYISADVMALLDKSRKPLAVFGIVLFGLRFFINLQLLLKHLLHSVLNDQLSFRKIIIQELKKRSFIMATDLVWAIIGLLTTYNFLFHISLTGVAPIVLSGLCFDVGLLIAQWIHDAIKYNQLIHELSVQLNEATTYEQLIIQRQIDILTDEYETLSACYLFNSVAAVFIALCFGVGMSVSGSLFLIGFALFSSIGNAMYNTVVEFKEYYQARIALQREKKNGLMCQDPYHPDLVQKLKLEQLKASTVFWKNLTVNIGAISFIITASVLYWPVSVLLTLIFIAYQLNESHQKEDTKKSDADVYRLMIT